MTTCRYRHSGVALVRAGTGAGQAGLPIDLDLSDEEAVRREGLAWLAGVWALADVREALTMASLDLAEHIARLVFSRTEPASTRDLRRAILPAATYLLRWQRRVTPFGLFAGVMPADVGPAAARIGVRHRAVARADADWIGTLSDRLERDQLLRPHLTVIADSSAVIRDGRLIVARRADPGSRASGAAGETSVRWTRPVKAAVEMAVSPVRFAVLTAALAERSPAAGPRKVRALLDVLVDEGFLITSLRPPMTAENPLDYLIGALRAAGAELLPATAPVLCELEGIAAELHGHDGCADPARAAAVRARVSARMAALEPATRYPLAVDVGLDGKVSLPGEVLDEAAAAADALLRLTTRPSGSVAWADYHARFLERYGPGALVLVRDLRADSGLGYPDGYLGTRRARPASRMLTERDGVLLGLIQQATIAGREEIVLTEDVVQALIAGELTAQVLPQRIELGVTVHARSLAAIVAGDFELRVVAAPRAATSMAGRFGHLLTASELERLAGTYRVAEDDAVAVQLSFPPRLRHNENVVRVAPLVSDVLPVGERPGGPADHVIGLDDLAVTADAAHMYLVHRSTGRRVIPRIAHALDVTVQTPPLARFLAEVADARTACFGPFDPGAARGLPYLPRFRYRRTVLAAARWLLSTGDLGSPGDGTGWETRLNAWRQRWRAPSRLVLSQGELRLPLNLDHRLDRTLLRARLDRSGRVELREDHPAGADGWIGRPAELLIPLTLVTPPARTLPVTARSGEVHQPGAPAVLRAQITGNPARFDDIIGGHLPAVGCSLAGLAERWWMRRYRDLTHPECPERLEICLRLASPLAFPAVATMLAGLAARLETVGLPGQLTFAPYYEQPGLYGHGEAMAAAEEVFAADTAAATAQIVMAAAAGIPAQALAAASMAQLAAAFGPDPESGYRALGRCVARGSGPLDRVLRDLACRLADPAPDFGQLRALPGGDAAAATWEQRDLALAAYREALAAERDPGTMLPTLLHEHHMRAIGLDPVTEKQTSRLARAAAHQRLALAALR